MGRFLRAFSLVAALALVLAWSGQSQTSGTLENIRKRGVLLWGSDAEGGAPYVFPDPSRPSRLIGFEVDLARAIARELGVEARQVQNAWDSLIPALERGDFDIALNGLEITPARRQVVLFSLPYYIYTTQLAVRKDEDRIREIGDLRGRKVGTLSGSVAQEILQAIPDVEIRVYTGQAEPYEDLVIGRIDAVLMDSPIAAYYAKPNPALRYAGPPTGEGEYGIAMRKADGELKAALGEILIRLHRSGELRTIYEKWGLWNESQEKLRHRLEAGSGAVDLEESRKAPLVTFLPTLLKGAGITVVVSVVSMAIAVALGLVLTLLRLYGPRWAAAFATAYIEFYRGTPLLVQLYILYYGLPNIGITLSPLAAAFIGLGMCYAAYEAELYRAGINSVPRGQMESALSLGMSRNGALRWVVLPQALRIATPGITNDFIALFKDSSLVSVIAMVELTKTYNILAATTLRFFELGLVVAFLYFAMSYPLSRMARRLEAKLKGEPV
ncbi:MAG: ABC transporter permease subunit [Syntrophaceae bacterium]|nr:ABC transporter permease subunit [Syntrophaceae bacterium]